MTKTIFSKKNVLVIGGAGFIGSHLCDELVKSSKVICVDKFLTGVERNIDHLLQNPNFLFVKHDIINPLSLDDKELGLEKFKAAWQGVQEIYFLASPSTRGEVEKYPVETMMANSVGLRNALDLAVESQAKFCYVSSASVYGESPDGKKIKESYQGVVRHIDNNGCYAVAQRFGEALVEAYRRNKELEVRVARLFNTYGPRMWLGGTRLIAEFTRKALSNEEIIIYNGSEARGSYCYVTDTIKGLLRTMEAGDEQPINIGSDQAIDLLDLAHKIIELTGSSAETIITPDLPDGHRQQLVPDIARAKEILSWFPIVLLDDGLLRTIEDLKASRELVGVSEREN